MSKKEPLITKRQHSLIEKHMCWYKIDLDLNLHLSLSELFKLGFLNHKMEILCSSYS